MNTAIWVLVVAHLGGSHKALMFQEFSTKAKCEQQAAKVESYYTETRGLSNSVYQPVRAWCAEK